MTIHMILYIISGLLLLIGLGLVFYGGDDYFGTPSDSVVIGRSLLLLAGVCFGISLLIHTLQEVEDQANEQLEVNKVEAKIQIEEILKKPVTIINSQSKEIIVETLDTPKQKYKVYHTDGHIEEYYKIPREIKSKEAPSIE